jgi:hypothetical protein
MLRSHMVRQDGTRRDSPYCGMLADEWPSLRDKLLTRVTAKVSRGRLKSLSAGKSLVAGR